MPKSLTLGNGSLLLCFDRFGLVRDFYFHYAGLENHVSENLVHKIGVFADGRLSWMSDGSWVIKIDCHQGTMAGHIVAKNEGLGLELDFTDVVYNEKNIFVRSIEVKNLFDKTRKVKIFFNQQFNISQTHTGDTAYFDPDTHSIIHYKGRRAFLVNAVSSGKGFQEYSVGILGVGEREGTFKDAEDGKLEKSPIEHGQVDSVIGLELSIPSKKSTSFHYWVTVGKSIKTVKRLNDYVVKKTPEYIVKSTKDYWHAWIHNQKFTFFGLSDPIVDLFKKSLANIRTHTSKNGSIIASGDSDLLQFGRDTYSYMWPRDAAISAIALAKSGDFNASKKFFEFCNDVITDEGYFYHKYRPDKALGSSWHPWIRNGKPELSIQEDETALVINALWTHFELSKDLEFIELVYNSLIKKATEFMIIHIDEKTGLPKPSYDLWEMKFGIHTFTAASVYGALNVASKIAGLLGKEKSSARYAKVAEKMKDGIMKHLYDDKEKLFYKSVNFVNGEVEIDATVDISSVYGIYKFKVLPFDDTKLKSAFENSVERLTVKADTGGIARFEGDIYHFKGGDVPGNPWFITTLWHTQYLSEFLKEEKDLPEFVKRFTWVVDRATDSGILSEQLDPYTGEQLSAAPLTWSHAEYVITIIQYLEKLEEIGICKACYPIS